MTFKFSTGISVSSFISGSLFYNNIPPLFYTSRECCYTLMQGFMITSFYILNLATSIEIKYSLFIFYILCGNFVKLDDDQFW